MAPTRFPTLTPTAEATNPTKPVFYPTNFSLEKLIVANFSTQNLSDGRVGDTAVLSNAVSLAPTNAPTVYPTLDGFVYRPMDKNASFVSLKLPFPVSVAQAYNPVMDQSLVEGLAASLGVAADKVG
jgi:hypothetical protein